MQISLYNIIRNEQYDPITETIVPLIDPETRFNLFSECAAWVARTARGKRRERIYFKGIGEVENCGIFNRLLIDTETKEVKYQAGQEWYSEMAILRDCFD